MSTTHELSEVAFLMRLNRPDFGRQSALERKIRLQQLRTRAKAVILRNLAGRNQREALNRRQRRAQDSGVILWRKGTVCGIPFIQRRW